MAAPFRPTDPSRPNPVVPAQWPAQAADTVVDAIGKVRDKTTKPALIAARTVVYGSLAAILAMVAVVMGLIIVGRMWSNFMPGENNIWILYVILAVLSTGGGLYFLRKANRPVSNDI